jgi:hypothetical protein
MSMALHHDDILGLEGYGVGMSGSLYGPVLKLQRAWEHQNYLRNGIAGGTFLDTHPVTCLVDRDGRTYRFYVGEIEDFDSDPWVVVFGDFLFNLRAALDQLVYELHVRHFKGKVTKEAEENSQFPIFEHARSQPFEQHRYISSLSKRHKEILKQLQPYLATAGTTDRGLVSIRNSLSTLNRLNIIDKHRRLHIARRAPFAYPTPDNFPLDCGFRTNISFDPLKSHAEVEVWTFDNYVPDNVAEEVEIHDHFISDVFILDGGTHETVEWLFASLHLTVYGIIDMFRADFPDAPTSRVVPIRVWPVGAGSSLGHLVHASRT